MVIFMSWLKSQPDLLQAFTEKRLVAFIGMGLGRWKDNVMDDAGKVHNSLQLENWAKEAFPESKFVNYGVDMRGIIFEDDVQATLFMINFGITYAPRLDTDL